MKLSFNIFIYLSLSNAIQTGKNVWFLFYFFPHVPIIGSKFQK